jgi:hypothetical protein
MKRSTLLTKWFFGLSILSVSLFGLLAATHSDSFTDGKKGLPVVYQSPSRNLRRGSPACDRISQGFVDRFQVASDACCHRLLPLKRAPRR